MAGLTAAELAALGTEEVARLRLDISQRLRAAGAHFVVDTIADLPPVLAVIDAQLRQGIHP
jgi:phosphonoacetaldehyde hydrolase